ncbi:hypothetical protein [Cytobacillus sp. FSL K6-0265]|uniref:hypothetical protein n=1 Tax=Cytobacillus sp. FSL K6-0265 TaxID=2921448 RepID=UPI0030FB29AC
MYKWQLALITGILLLSACNSNSVEESDMNKEKTHEVSQSSDEKEANSKSGNPSVPVQNIANDKISNEKDLSSLPEYGKIIELIGDQDYLFTKESDTGSKRVFIIEQNGEKQYKTIFIKKTNRLKVIKIHGNGGEVFNQILP